MTTTFLEPGGDATFDFSLFTSKAGTASIATDIVHGGHVKSISCQGGYVRQVNSGFTGRTSFYLYIVTLDSGNAAIHTCANGKFIFELHVTSAGVLQVNDSFGGGDVGSPGATLSTGQWYRITICWNATSNTVNEIRVYVNGGAATISITNGTFTSNGGQNNYWGNPELAAAFDCRVSDIYRDDSNSANDVATDVWVTSKRPVANGTTNGFTTQIGAGGSGYGTGHSPQVNERPLDATNGWSMIGAGSAVTEEYTVEAASVGDISITGATIIDYMGWVWAKSLAGETASIVVGGTSSNISLTSTAKAFLTAKGSTSYPGGGTDIGIITDTSLTTVSLYECGLMLAYTPLVVTVTTDWMPVYHSVIRALRRVTNRLGDAFYVPLSGIEIQGVDKWIGSYEPVASRRRVPTRTGLFAIDPIALTTGDPIFNGQAYYQPVPARPRRPVAEGQYVIDPYALTEEPQIGKWGSFDQPRPNRRRSAFWSGLLVTDPPAADPAVLIGHSYHEPVPSTRRRPFWSGWYTIDPQAFRKNEITMDMWIGFHQPVANKRRDIRPRLGWMVGDWTSSLFSDPFVGYELLYEYPIYMLPDDFPIYDFLESYPIYLATRKLYGRPE